MLGLLDTFWGIAAWFVVIVVLLQLITVISLTVSYARRQRKRGGGGYPTVDLPPIALEEGTMQLYMDGVSLFDDMREAIAGAERAIFFETFIWKNDAIGREFRDLLVARAREGVNVYLVYDLIGNGLLGRSRIRFPSDVPRLHVQRFFPFKRLIHFVMPSRYNVTHRKTLIIDDRVGFVGGYNLGDEYRTEWRDTHMSVTGDGAQRLSYAFADLWNQYRHPGLPELEYPEQSWSKVLDVYRNDPLRRVYPIRNIYLRAIERAQRHVLITNAYFVPDPVFRRALKLAAARGVDVQIVFPWRSNHAVVDAVARHYFSDYLDAGIRLFGYEGTMLHTKSMTIDGEWSIVGTANLDRLSLALNHEINVEIFDARVAAQMEAVFASDRGQSRQLEIEPWRARPLRMRLGERILSPLWPFV
jgi:cardiolipin synthase